jgi:hypothetical protein
LIVFGVKKTDEECVMTVISNALKIQEKNEKTQYFKDIAKSIKDELDSQRGYIYC